jgi:enoyl-CoA hydratase
MVKTFENILLEVNEKVATITINRPKQLNALNKNTISELGEAFTSLDNDSSIKAIVITGSGEKSFVAGADIKEFADFNVEQGSELSKKGHEKLFTLVENLSTPVIAAINGFALGGGLELAMSAHIRIASNNARVGLPEVTLGLIPGYGGTQRLAQLVGRGKALEMIMTGGMYPVTEAQNWGLLNDVVEPESLLDTCNKLASKISRNSSTAIASAIKSVNANYLDGVNGYNTEVTEFGKCFGTKDFVEGTTAFLEKRKPNFK